MLGGIAALWTLAVGLHYRREIQEELVRSRSVLTPTPDQMPQSDAATPPHLRWLFWASRFRKALGLGKKYTLHQLRLGAHKLFDGHDHDNSGALDMGEIMHLLHSIGKDVSLQDVEKYIERVRLVRCLVKGG